MSYCVSCGVELANSEKRCPLCHTEVIDPNRPAGSFDSGPFPPHLSHATQEVSRHSLVGLLTLIFLVPVLLCLVIDARINREILWSGYVLGAFLQLHVMIAVPILLSKKPSRKNAVIALSADYFVLLCFQWYIVWHTGGEWFWPFAFPVTILSGVIIMALLLLSRYTEFTRLGISAVTILCLGLFCTVLECLINRVFGVRDELVWSIYPLLTGLLLSAILFYIDTHRPLKEKLIRKFFI